MQELDFSFKKQVSDSALRESKFELFNTIKADIVDLDFNMALFRNFL